MPTPTASVKVNPLTGALIDPIAATFASANGFLTGGTSDAKDSVVCATTANGTLATAFENGDTVDGIVLATGNRILIKNQSSQAENGIYTVNASGAPTRATDFDVWTEIVGAFVSVESGTVNAGTQWLCNVVSGGTLNTTAITFVVPKNYVDLTTAQNIAGLKTFTSGINTTGATSEILTLGANAYIRTTGAFAGISTEGEFGVINTIGASASIQTSGLDATIFTTGANAHIFTYNAGAYIQTRSTFKLFGGTYTTTVSHSATADRALALPDADGTLATTTGNVATATALATARNIFNISFNGTANVAGDATNTGHFASIPGTGEAGHFVTQNGTAPTLIAGRSAWYSDGSGVPSFKNGTGTAVTLVRSSDLGTGIATFLATPSSANLASSVTDETGSGALVFGTSPTFTTAILVPDGTEALPGIRFSSDTDTGLWREGTNQFRAVVGGSGVCIFGTDGTTQSWGFATSLTKRTIATGEVFVAMQAFSGAIWGIRIGDPAAKTYIRAAASQTANIMEWQSSAGTSLASIDKGGNPSFPKTITAGGTTGAQTIDKASGSVNFAAAATSLVVTNSLCTTSSVIHCTIATNDATAANVKAVAAAGSFTIYLTAPTAETRVNFLLTN